MNISELEHQFKSLTTRGLGFTDHEIPKKERSWGAYRAVMLRLVVVVKVLLQMRARVGGGTPEHGADELLPGPEQAADAVGDGGARPVPALRRRRRRRRRRGLRRWQQQGRRLRRRRVGWRGRGHEVLWWGVPLEDKTRTQKLLLIPGRSWPAREEHKESVPILEWVRDK